MFLTLLPAPKWTKLTPDMRHNIVIEHVKKNGGAFSTFEKIATEALSQGQKNGPFPNFYELGTFVL